MSKKYRFDVKVTFIEDNRVQITLFAGSQFGKPIAKGTIEKLGEASPSAFIEMVRQLDGGVIVQMPQYEK